MKQVKFEVNEEGGLSFTEVEVEPEERRPGSPIPACPCGSREFVALYMRHAIVNLDGHEVKVLPLTPSDIFCKRCERFVAPGTKLYKLISHYLESRPWRDVDFEEIEREEGE